MDNKNLSIFPLIILALAMVFLFLSQTLSRESVWRTVVFLEFVSLAIIGTATLIRSVFVEDVKERRWRFKTSSVLGHCAVFGFYMSCEVLVEVLIPALFLFMVGLFCAFMLIGLNFWCHEHSLPKCEVSSAELKKS